ncbi:hypothetical protein [Paraburkholderia sp. UCT2]|uniref:hypothetical protein n=1 Tax=Paraburkholderia sp. UCT2 TaxID=2615208 RepID=UPI0016561F7E|nr:hypothetical protein [Paraburkholderia sp. UCT2]MBC8733285.1 hypothetical protein [Paraburkholderia sp. UCT2]
MDTGAIYRKGITMAVWQYSFWALPKIRLGEIYGSAPSEIGEDEFNSIEWFDGYDVEEFIRSIDYLDAGQHWNKEVVFFGSYEGDSISIERENGKLDGIYFRVDLRGNYRLMATKMIESIRSRLLVLVKEDLTVPKGAEEFIAYLKYLADRRHIAG